MTAVNNLALMLSESLRQMQQQQMQKKGQSSSNGSCNKPGGEGEKMKSIRKLQEQLNKQLQQMKDGTGKPSQGKKESRQMSEKLARMAAQQEAIRKQLQEVGEETQNQGTGMDKKIKEMMQQMDQTETDLVKNISRETLMRQQEILTRLLESEKAIQQREMDEKRESNEGNDNFYNNPSKFFEYHKLKEKETEMIRTVPPKLKPFYKGKVNTYFLSFE
jgi:type III secretory pathway component EscV